jgi:cytochrome P450
MGSIVLGFFPSIIARKGYLARAKLASILLPYYKAGYDQTEETSALVKERGRLFRKWDMPVDEIAKNEVAVMLVAVANTIPTMFWLFYHVWTRPELVDRLQQEAAQHVACLSATEGKLPPAGVKEITITYSSIGETCPLLHSCFREVARLASQNATLRRVLEDTVLRDENGQSWVLKKGNNVILPGECLHRDRDTWGEDADEFNPERFLPNNTPTKKKERLRKLSYVPFGGGRHLCPGRRFALAETLSFMAALVLGFDVEGLDPEKTRMQWSKMGQAAKPLPGYEGGPVTVRRRKGWEHVVWKFDA